MLSRLCSQTAVSKTFVTHGDWALAFKGLNISRNPGKTPVGIPASGPGLVTARIGKLLTAIDKNKVPFFCQVVGQSSGPGAWVWPRSFAFPGELTRVFEVRLTQGFLTSYDTPFYDSSRKSTREQLVQLITGLVAKIDPLIAIPDTTQFYTKSKAAHHRLLVGSSCRVQNDRKCPKYRASKNTKRTILWLAKIQAVFETPKGILCQEFRPVCGPDGSKKCIFRGNGLFLARDLAQVTVHCPSKAR